MYEKLTLYVIPLWQLTRRSSALTFNLNSKRKRYRISYPVSLPLAVKVKS